MLGPFVILSNGAGGEEGRGRTKKGCSITLCFSSFISFCSCDLNNQRPSHNALKIYQKVESLLDNALT